MKKITLLILIVLSICSCKQEVTDFGIVTEIKLYDRTLTEGYRTKYKVTVNKNFNAVWRDVKVFVYTNELYIIGDTIVVTNKNNLKDKNHEQRN